ncbi:MAG: cell division ATPase MinD [Nanoarchaeota archaeon]|nr:cell division ATPase MinD [Nanoarchaeota archaeon]
MARVILILSGKGGVGKTTTSINLSAALHELGKDVLLVDSSLTTPDVGIHLGSPTAPINFHHVLSGRAKPHEAIYLHSSGFKVIPGSISLKDLRNAKPERMKKAIHSLKRYADFIIVDSAAGFSRETLHAIEAASELIVVTNPDLPSITNALKATKIAESHGKAVTGIIVTRKKSRKSEMTIKNIAEMLESEILGIIPEDDRVKDSIDLKEILLHKYPNSRASKAYKKIASRLIGQKYQEQQETFFGKFLRNMGFSR